MSVTVSRYPTRVYHPVGSWPVDRLSKGELSPTRRCQNQVPDNYQAHSNNETSPRPSSRFDIKAHAGLADNHGITRQTHRCLPSPTKQRDDGWTAEIATALTDNSHLSYS